MKNIIIILLTLLTLNTSAITLSREATISILTCSPGDEMYSLFGHTGIRVTDPTQGLDIVFNYGTFDFSTEGFYFKFARGLLPYQLSVSRYRHFEAAYRKEGRSIYSQTLLLDSVGRQRLMDLLEENYRPENRSYLYNFLYDNCSTRVCDIIERALDGEVEWRKPGEGKSFWNLLDEYMGGSPWIQWGIHTILGSPANATATVREEMFLPDYLMHALDSAYHDGRRLTAPVATLYKAPERKDGLPWWLTPGCVFLAGAALLACLLWRFRSGRLMRAVAFPFFLATGIIGCLLVFLGFFTAHPTTAPNFNLVWANPLNLVAAFCLRKRIPRIVRGYLRIYLWILGAGFVCWFLLTPAVVYSSMALIAWMAYLSYRLRAFPDKRTSPHR